MRIETVPAPIFVSKVPNYKEHKGKILELIAAMGEHSSIIADQRISNSDFHLNPNVNRPYFSYITPILEAHCGQVKNFYGFDFNIQIGVVWFQQYKKGDFHGMHSHSGCTYTNVFYVSLPKDAPKTTLFLGGHAVEIDVEEGDIITFPAIYLHESRPNMSDSEKLVIAFNSNLTHKKGA